MTLEEFLEQEARRLEAEIERRGAEFNLGPRARITLEYRIEERPLIEIRRSKVSQKAFTQVKSGALGPDDWKKMLDPALPFRYFQRAVLQKFFETNNTPLSQEDAARLMSDKRSYDAASQRSAMNTIFSGANLPYRMRFIGAARPFYERKLKIFIMEPSL